VTSNLAISKQVKIQVNDRINCNGDTKTQGSIPVVPSFLREVRLHWRGVVLERPPTPQRLTLFFGEQATKASSRSTKRCPWWQHEIFTQSIGVSSTTQLKAPNRPTKLLHTKIEQGGRLLSARVPRNPRVTSPSMKWRGKSNRLGGSVNLGILPRIPKGFQGLVARMGDLVI
jgi:hypothetical protein